MTTTVRATPAPRVASTTWRTTGRPATEWRSFDQRDCMRLPRPAARMRASVSRRLAPRAVPAGRSSGTGPTGRSGKGLLGIAACPGCADAWEPALVPDAAGRVDVARTGGGGGSRFGAGEATGPFAGFVARLLLLRRAALGRGRVFFFTTGGA